VPCGGRETGGREGPGHGGRQCGAKDVAGNGTRPSGAGSGAIARTGESGLARATRRCATDMRGRVASGLGGSGRGTREREEWGSAAILPPVPLQEQHVVVILLEGNLVSWS
jgi:hypothetical protein